MKKIFLISAVCFLASGLQKTQAQPTQDEMMKAWQAYMTPGDAHKMIAKSDGQWKAEVTVWMAPGAPPEKSTATATNKMILGGRYQQSTHKGMFNGMPFEGISTFGYDNAKKVYVSSWIDNMGTGMMNMEGTWDDATKTVNMKGKSVDPGTGKDIDVREAFKIINDNTQLLEMYMTGADGAEFKTMEIKFTRNVPVKK